MTEPGLPVLNEEQEDTFLRNIHRLFFRPRAYFEGIKAPKKKGWLLVFALTFGVAGAISRWDAKAPTSEIANWTWPDFWLMIVGFGVLGGIDLLFPRRCVVPVPPLTKENLDRACDLYFVE